MKLEIKLFKWLQRLCDVKSNLEKGDNENGKRRYFKETK